MKENIGLRIKIARVARRWTQQDLADKVNKTRPLITRIETTGLGHPHTIKQICKVLGIAVDDEGWATERGKEYTYNTELLKLKEDNELLLVLTRSQLETITDLRNEVLVLKKKVEQLQRKLLRK